MVGTAVAIRVSSSIAPSAVHRALYSTRTRTRVRRLTWRSTSRRRSTGTSMIRIGVLRADEGDEVDEAVRVAPLVVVPAEHLHHPAVRHRVDRREDARRRV